jgi:hypothetical protein
MAVRPSWGSVPRERAERFVAAKSKNDKKSGARRRAA